MKRLTGMLLCAALTLLHGPVQARVYNQAELDALLAPIALYPDPLLSQILVAATYPQDVAEAAAWSRANPRLAGDDAVRAVEGEPWDASVKALVAFPEVLSRMAESPQWTGDLGQAFLEQEPYVMDTVQALRRRAQEAGNLQSNDQYTVQQYGSTIAVLPAQPQLVYVPYYDPYVVYGTWWWPAYRPVFWRPWAPHPVFVTQTFFFARPDWHRRHVRVIQRPVQVTPFVRVPEANRQPVITSTPQIHRPFAAGTPQVRREVPRLPQQRTQIQERRGEWRAQMPAAPGFTPTSPRVEPRQMAQVQRQPQVQHQPQIQYRPQMQRPPQFQHPPQLQHQHQPQGNGGGQRRMEAHGGGRRG